MDNENETSERALASADAQQVEGGEQDVPGFADTVVLLDDGSYAVRVSPVPGTTQEPVTESPVVNGSLDDAQLALICGDVQSVAYEVQVLNGTLCFFLVVFVAWVICRVFMSLLDRAMGLGRG